MELPAEHETSSAIFSGARVRRPARLPDAWFSARGLAIDDLAAVLEALGVVVPDVELAEALPEVRNHGVDAAPTGVIQDPAGSAVGAPVPSGGGASGAIYARFGDLQAIPAMPEKAAVCNASVGPGRRVLHSHAPQLVGQPQREADRSANLAAMATTYANALLAFVDAAPRLGPDGATLHLVPVSSSIYAGSFARDRIFTRAHLDPSYTIVAIVAALAHVRAQGTPLPHTTLCYRDRDVYERALDCRADLERVLRG